MRDPSTLVAIVDDDVAVRRALIRLVRALSYQSSDFPCGTQLIASFRNAIPDCVLLDYHMPEATGIQVMEDMKKAGFSIPVIMMSGFDRPGLCAECLRSGAATYLVKPLTAATLSAAIVLALQDGDDREGPRQPKTKTIPRCAPVQDG